jgi:predicted LPLAT superfamily acyltransferase
MKESWRAQRERGSRILMSAIAGATLALGRSFGRFFLTPISLYFLAFGPRARAASAAYLARIYGRPARVAEVYRHIHTFASTIHDRVLLLAGRTKAIDIAVEGEELIHIALAEHRRGCLLLGAHLGSFEALRTIAARRNDIPTRILMETENAARIQSVLDSIQPGLADWVIPLGAPTTLLTVKESLERNEVVGILADRVWRNDRTLTLPFLGAPAEFPLGPFRLASALATPVVLGVGLYRGGNRYTLYFERLDPPDWRPEADHAHRASQLLTRYVARLEHYCRLAPYNWFNFYEFWR